MIVAIIGGLEAKKLLRDDYDSNWCRPPFMPGRLQRDWEGGKMTWIFRGKMFYGFPDGNLAAAAGKS